MDLLASADLVISKGMANFETLYSRDVAAPVFFLFKVNGISLLIPGDISGLDFGQIFREREDSCKNSLASFL